MARTVQRACEHGGVRRAPGRAAKHAAPRALEPDAATANLLRLLRKDEHAARNEWIFSPPRALLAPLRALLCDERDLPIALLFLNVLVLSLPAAAAVFAARSHVLGCLYLVANTLCLQERFTLALHYASHRRLTRWGALNALPTHVLAPLFGIPPGQYHLHHVVMHHNEHNIFPWDISSTEQYQRDSLLHFLCYWLRFVVAVWIELPLYACARGRPGLAARSVCGTALTAALYARLWCLHPVGTLWVLVLPTLLGSLCLMFGNWSQHLFIDPDATAATPFSYTYNAVDTPHNQTSFNDGYHIEHHRNARRHWSQMPALLANNLADDMQRYREHNALIFHGLGFMQIGWLALRQDLPTLAAHIVPLETPAPPPQYYEALLRARLRRLPRPRAAPARQVSPST